MKLRRYLLMTCTALSTLCSLLGAQQPSVSSTPAVVPRLVNFSGKTVDAQGKIVTGVVGVTFAIYQAQYEGAPLWMETQNVQADAKGNYTVQLGATKPDGLPLDLFTSGEGRWLGVRINGGEEQARILLLSVPYALKAADAETVGGLPASAFVLAAPAIAAGGQSSSVTMSGGAVTAAVSGTGTTDFLPLWTNATGTLGNSILFQSGAGATAKVGINTTAPAVTLDVNGAENVHGILNLVVTGTANATAGKNSQPLDFTASVFNSSTATAVPQKFQWQAEPTGNNTTSASGALSLLYASGTATPAETGLKIAKNGIISFATGQTFPGAEGVGTVTSVASGTGLKGGPITTSGTLSVDSTKVPLLAATNTFTAAQTFNGFVFVTNVLGESSTVGGNVLFGLNNATSGTGSNGVFGETASPAGIGTVGINFSSAGFGVFGGSTGSAVDSVGVFGLTGSQESNTEQIELGPPATGVGVWGDAGNKTLSFAVVGTADDGVAGLFANNSPTGYETLQVVAVNGNSNPLTTFGANGTCTINGSGDLTCTGTKNAGVPVDGGKRIVAMSAIESPVNWFEDAGEAEMLNGAAVVQLDSTYTQTVNTEMKYQVFLTPYGDCKGLYVTNRTADSFEVHELGGGTASLSFGYRIMALRKKYENVRFADRTRDFDGRDRMLARIHAAAAAKHQSSTPTTRLFPAGAPVPAAVVK